MVLERLVQVAGVPDGLVSSLRDCALYSAALGLGGFDGLVQNLELIRAPDLSRLRILDDCTLDAGGLHAWFVAEIALDLAVASKRCGGGGRVLISNVMRPDELGVADAFAVRHGFAVVLDKDTKGDVTLTLGPASATRLAPLDSIRRNGLPVATDLWWRLYHSSAAALAPDTVSSRRHAGPIIITEDGRIVGRQDDDETDISLLTSAARVPQSNPAA
jgi:hypothetical protein